MLSFRRFLKSKSRRDVTESTDQFFTQDLSKDTLMDCDNKNMDEDVYSETWSVSRESTDSEVLVNKTVSFTNVVMVCIVPSRKDLAPIWKDLWWSFEECDSFKKQADWELKAHSNEYGCDFKESIRSLYQPDIESLRIDEESQHQTKILYAVYNKHKFRSKLRSSQSNSNTNTNSYSRTTLPSTQSQSLASSFTLSTPTNSDDGSSSNNSRSSTGTKSICSDPTTPPTTSVAANFRNILVFTKPLVKEILVDKSTTPKISSRNQNQKSTNHAKEESPHKKANRNNNFNNNNNNNHYNDNDGFNYHHTTGNNNNNNHNHNNFNGNENNGNFYYDNDNNYNNNNNISNHSQYDHSQYHQQQQPQMMNNSNHFSSENSDGYHASLYGNLGIMRATSSTKGLRK